MENYMTDVAVNLAFWLSLAYSLIGSTVVRIRSRKVPEADRNNEAINVMFTLFDATVWTAVLVSFVVSVLVHIGILVVTSWLSAIIVAVLSMVAIYYTRYQMFYFIGVQKAKRKRKAEIKSQLND